jgi:hypothetical protein
MGADGTGQAKLNRLSAQSLLVALSNQLVGNGLSKRGNKRGKTCSTKFFHLSPVQKSFNAHVLVNPGWETACLITNLCGVHCASVW